MECFTEFSEVLCGRKEAGKRCTKCSSFFFSYFLGRSVGVLEEEAEWN